MGQVVGHVITGLVRVVPCTRKGRGEAELQAHIRQVLIAHEAEQREACQGQLCMHGRRAQRCTL